jgi:uncharacterized protein YgiM (DUF1202 family)
MCVCQVRSSYESAYPDPLVLHAGDKLTVGDRESEWHGWLWCTVAGGKSGWVPERYVERNGHTGVALSDYDATELTVHAGQELVIGERESGWVWCTNQAGESGWVPVENLGCEADDLA